MCGNISNICGDTITSDRWEALLLMLMDRDFALCH